MNLLSTLFSIAARLVLAVASIVLFLVIFAVVLLWSLVRGRKPTLHTATFRRAAQFRSQAFRPDGMNGMNGSRAPQGEVIDAEVREVPNSDPRLER